jgi:hypothetical protein
MPIRYQASRRKGARQPAGALRITRWSRWCNPFVLIEQGGTYTREESMAEYRRRLIGGTLDTTPRDADGSVKAGFRQRPLLGVEECRREIAGRDVVCACGLDQLCHGDILLEIANSTGPVTR